MVLKTSWELAVLLPLAPALPLVLPPAPPPPLSHLPALLLPTAAPSPALPATPITLDPTLDPARVLPRMTMIPTAATTSKAMTTPRLPNPRPPSVQDAVVAERDAAGETVVTANGTPASGEATATLAGTVLVSKKDPEAPSGSSMV